MSQAMAITYEGAGVDMMMPYFRHVFKPLAPLQVYGRWAGGSPGVKPDQALW